MSTIQLVIVCLTLLFLALIVASHDRERIEAPEVEPLVREGRVSLTVDSGQSVEGVVVSGPEGFITLAGATLKAPGVKPTGLGGVVKLREDSVTFVQELDAPENDGLRIEAVPPPGTNRHGVPA